MRQAGEMLALLNAEGISLEHEQGLIFKKRRSILKDISMELVEGETLGLMGVSGSGKTTLAKIMAGLEHPSSGIVSFQGKDIRPLSGKEYLDFRRSVQMIFQDPEGSLNPRKSIEGSIHEVLGLLRIPKRHWRARTSDILNTVGLSEELLCRCPGQVSGGQNQRIVLARVLLLNPKVMILDEPTSALDLSVQAYILTLLKKLQKERGLSYLLISHQADVVRFMAHEVYVLGEGRLKRV
ncbi:Trehalose/maltose import ATP-binding protein MalK [uncultured archaeon]|nr:Trehalose/maltose import ATP-binding protein MalK [uncultured archaeon]